ncbi:hypothetical protein, partial [Gordonibacter sp.]|uniref:hypothetical protein n=1 Tax=Gordonibacter sp. TaxID=1968902 RepID=UPI002FC7314E
IQHSVKRGFAVRIFAVFVVNLKTTQPGVARGRGTRRMQMQKRRPRKDTASASEYARKKKRGGISYAP